MAESVPLLIVRLAPSVMDSGVPVPELTRPNKAPDPIAICRCSPATTCARVILRAMPFWLTRSSSVSEDAVAAAEEEFEFAASLCNHPLDTLIAMHRSHDGGEIREAFRTLRPKDGPKPLRAFAFLDVEGEDEPADEVDLAAMAKDKKSE